MPKHHPEPCESPIVQDLIELDEAVNDLHGALHLHANKEATTKVKDQTERAQC